MYKVDGFVRVLLWSEIFQ